MGGALVFSTVFMYILIMVPGPAQAEFARDDLMLVQGKAYFFIEDHIGRPVMLLEHDDTDSDGDGVGDACDVCPEDPDDDIEIGRASCRERV